MPRVESSVIIKAGREQVFATVRDMERFPEFVRDVKSLRVVERQSDRQVSEWRTDIDGTPVAWTEEDVFDPGSFTCRFRAVQSDFRYEGSWLLTEEENGATRLTLKADFDWGIPNFEKFFGHVYERKARLAVRGMLNAIKKRMTNDKFAFLFHPYNVDILAERGIRDQTLKTMNRRLVERSMRWLPAIRRESVMIHSKTGRSVEGEMVMVPLICDHILNMDQQFVLDKTVEGARLAKNLGAKLIGLGAYLSPVGRRGALVSRAVGLPVTSGTSYTIGIAIEATLKAARDTNLDLGTATVSVIGATGAICRICACVLARQVDTLVLMARNQERLRALEDELRRDYRPNNIRLSDSIKDAVRDSDIVIISTNDPNELLHASDLPPGCIVCDVSVPHNISAGDADKYDVLVVDGGLVQCPGDVNFDYLALPPGVAYACLSEVMILALEGRCENFSTGGNISVEKVMEISALAEKHGFSLASFRSFGVEVPEEKLRLIEAARQRRRLN